ncbi:MAG: hypothetical protein HYV03_07175 [Deltaproteobacteria bacterium]|nr:hypothetical protein [Deltaproteobacteria bacterium]
MPEPVNPLAKKVHIDDLVYSCGEKVLSTIGLSDADREVFWSSDQYADSASSLLDHCDRLLRWYGEDLKAIRFARRGEMIFEMDNAAWMYGMASGAEVLFHNNGSVFSDRQLSNLVRTWLGQLAVAFPKALSLASGDHPASRTSNYLDSLAYARTLGSVTERVDRAGRLILEYSMHLTDGTTGVGYNAFDSSGRIVEMGFPAKWRTNSPVSVMTLEYDSVGRETRQRTFEDGRLSYKTENVFDRDGNRIRMVNTHYSGDCVRTIIWHFSHDGILTHVQKIVNEEVIDMPLPEDVGMTQFIEEEKLCP